MNILNQSIAPKTRRPIKVIQYGEGNFLRGFVDYMIDTANKEGVMDAGIVIVKPIEFGSLENFVKQDCVYTLSLRGRLEGKTVVENSVITSVDSVVDAYSQYKEYMELAHVDTLRFVVSNTTEAGIVFDAEDKIENTPPKTFPGKLTKFLYERFTYFNGDETKGLVMVPVELIEANGKKLKECVLQFIQLWGLPDAFKAWVESACIFCTTLVDRIITGYPKDEAESLCNELGYEDKLLDSGELFALWVIESDKDISKEFPLDKAMQNKAQMDVIFTNDIKPYRDRKVRILNGVHTSSVLAAYLAGKDYILECMDDPTIRTYMQRVIFNDVIPTLTLPEQELKDFANSVIERFENPYIKHALLSISMNSVSKWKARVLPSFTGYIEKTGNLPKYLTFSFAALLAFYTGKDIQNGQLQGTRGQNTYNIFDDAKNLQFFQKYSTGDVDEYVQKAASNVDFWGEDLSRYEGFVPQVAAYVKDIRTRGMRAVLEDLVK